MPFFSIILPTFNRGHLIERAICSVIEQTYPNWELLIVDDGSTDCTFDRISCMIRRDRRIEYIYSANGGPSHARNLGLRVGRGEYFTFLDSDDEYGREHLTLRADYLAENPDVELLHGGLEVVGPATVRDRHDPSREISIADCAVGGTFVIRRDLARSLEGFREMAYGDDSDFFERAESQHARIEKVEWPTYRYNRLESDSLCSIVEREGLEGIARYRQGQRGL